MSIKLKRTDEEMKWKTLSSEYVVKEPWMTVRKDKLLLPDGRVKDDYWSLEYPDWINVIATTKDGHYIFERQYRHGLDCVAWEIPAGVIEKGEEPLAAARRELMEETGFGGGEWANRSRLIRRTSSNTSSSTDAICAMPHSTRLSCRHTRDLCRRASRCHTSYTSMSSPTS